MELDNLSPEALVQILAMQAFCLLKKGLTIEEVSMKLANEGLDEATATMIAEQAQAARVIMHQHGEKNAFLGRCWFWSGILFLLIDVYLVEGLVFLACGVIFTGTYLYLHGCWQLRR